MASESRENRLAARYSVRGNENVSSFRFTTTKKCELSVDDESARLLKEYVDGSSDAATEIFHKYVAGLIALARTQLHPVLQRRLDPEDIVQSAYRSFFSEAKEANIVLKRSGDLWRVLAAFTINKARKRIEKELAQKRDPRLEAGRSVWVNIAVEGDPTPEQVNNVVEQLEFYMQQLTSRDRLILELRLRGESVFEIAEQLNFPGNGSPHDLPFTSEATVRRVLRIAKEELRERLFRE